MFSREVVFAKAMLLLFINLALKIAAKLKSEKEILPHSSATSNAEAMQDMERILIILCSLV